MMNKPNNPHHICIPFNGLFSVVLVISTVWSYDRTARAHIIAKNSQWECVICSASFYCNVRGAMIRHVKIHIHTCIKQIARNENERKMKRERKKSKEMEKTQKENACCSYIIFTNCAMWGDACFVYEIRCELHVFICFLLLLLLFASSFDTTSEWHGLVFVDFLRFLHVRHTVSARFQDRNDRKSIFAMLFYIFNAHKISIYIISIYHLKWMKTKS